MNAEYQLDIYIWPAMTGIDPEIRTTYLDSPEDAARIVERETQPYHLAVLGRKNESGYWPCDWNGNRVSHNQEWPYIKGINGHHPAYLAMRSDWIRMINIACDEHTRTGGALIDIATRLLSERHPQIHGWALTLAEEAARVICGQF
jgi:hypothetical protein